MPTRVSPADVKGIIDTDLTESEISPFITTANIIVNDELAGKGLSEDRLTQIELYLAAHYLTLRDPRLSQLRTGDTTQVYQGQTGKGLESTFYGQTAISLDSTGTLARAGLQKRTKIRVFGATDR